MARRIKKRIRKGEVGAMNWPFGNIRNLMNGNNCTHFYNSYFRYKETQIDSTIFIFRKPKKHNKN